MRGQANHPVFNCPCYNAINLYSKESFGMRSLNVFQSSEIIIDSRIFFLNCTYAKHSSHWKGPECDTIICRMPSITAFEATPPNWEDVSHLQSDYLLCRQTYCFPFLAGWRGPSLPVRHLVINAAVMSFFLSPCHCTLYAFGFTQKYLEQAFKSKIINWGGYFLEQAPMWTV